MLNLARINSLGDALRDTIVTHKTNVALIEADRHRENARLTYRELRTEAERLGALLQERGFAVGDRCAILMQNQWKWVATATGALWAGATLVPLDYKATPSDQLGLLAHAHPKVLVTEYSTWRKLVEAAEPGALDGIRVLIPEVSADETLEPGTTGAIVEPWETPTEQTISYRERARGDVACIVYSSGTGGVPKGCMLTHGNYLAQAEILGRLYPIGEDDRYFSVIPTNHAIDFMCGFVLTLLFGAAVVHQRTLRPQFLRATMKEYGITHIALVPTILKNLERRIRDRLDDLPRWQRVVVDGLINVNESLTRRRPRHGLSNTLLRPIHEELGGKLKLIFCGGAFVDRASAEFFYRLGLPVAIGYGLTEAGTVVSVNDLEPFRGDTVGRPVDDVEVEIREQNEAGVGEVWVRGPTVMKGYVDEPQLTAETIVDGWLRTGDLGTLDASGHLKLVGRLKNMIVTEGGKNIYPEDIESAFEDIDGCEEHCVFAANFVWPADSLLGEELMIVVRPTNGEGHGVLIDEIRARNRRLADFKRLSGYLVWTEEFPRTASLKVKRNKLRDEIVQRLDRAAGLVEL